MYRPGVDYWAGTHPSTQLTQPAHIPPSRSPSSGPPSLSRASTVDFRTPSADAPHARAMPGVGGGEPPTGSSSPSQNSPPFSFSTATAGEAASDPSLKRGNSAEMVELEATKKQVAQLQQQQRQEEERVRRMQSAWKREGFEYANELKTLQASLERERVLRTTAEQERQSVVCEAQQLRAALRAFLTEPLLHNGSAGTPHGSTVPLPLYEEARRLLLCCERTFAELKMLQLKATNAAGLERLRRYNVPVLDGIPPAWPPETPRRICSNSKTMGDAQNLPSSTQLEDGSAALFTPKPTVAAEAAPSPADETPTGLEVSALTTVSPDTPCSYIAPDRPTNASYSLYNSENNTPQEGAEGRRPHFAMPGAASTEALQTTRAPNGGAAGGVRRVLLSPSIVSSSADVGDAPPEKQADEAAARKPPGAKAVGSGPMNAYAADAQQSASAAAAVTAALPQAAADELTVPLKARLHPQLGEPLSEFEREDIIRDTDQLIRQLSRETVALAKSQGVYRSSDVAALCRRRGLDYIDSAFLPVTETLGLASGGCRGYDPDKGSSYVVQWSTRDAFLPKGRRAELLTSAGVDPNALRCGRLGDTGVVAALAALAEATGAIVSVLASTTSEEEENGIYVVWLCVRGWWKRVTVDAYLPCLCEPDQTVTLYGCSNIATYDLWPSVCEKALAKVYGSYQALCHLTADIVLGHLTGGPVECWDWWQRCSDSALDEIEAAINTSARGAGMVLLTTHSAAVLQGNSLKGNATGARAEYERLGLLPGVSYRVLAVTENADGEALLLLRNWASTTFSGRTGGTPRVGGREADRRDISPLRSDEGRSWPVLDPMPKENAAAADAAAAHGGGNDESGGCIWLNYAKQIHPLFDKCFACFDCRRFHDMRFPIHFAGSAPAVPEQLIRVRVQDWRERRTRGVTPCPTRLWIGLHQPGADESDIDAQAPWALKVTLIGQEDASLIYADRGCYRRNYGDSGMAAAPPPPPPHTRPARRSYVLSESFMGEPQPLPAVWMYLELDPDDGTLNACPSDHDATATEFFVVPQMELVNALQVDCMNSRCIRGALDRDRNHYSGATSKGFTHNRRHDDVDNLYDGVQPVPSLHGHSSSAITSTNLSFGSRAIAVVSILAEQKDSVAVDVVEAPAELRAAIYHDVVDRIDYSECASLLPERTDLRRMPASPSNSAAAAPTSVMDAQFQVNGHCVPTFSW
ncbi:hypothetical protein ABL78_1655 [Leptomonas seymouri]|uniref:Calpain catalytic domain-containing protein n=1 Tax=Leptomonas seymouri TaxID=5684 RepID=A0A0N1I1X2_LEPSE|nr:hypothetical protein ABL78_1655 [Leptomonas seymouri]|eukprot:KPI89232.1 hypothetical protein ABL78_1655 [Leptomonas seymouri]